MSLQERLLPDFPVLTNAYDVRWAARPDTSTMLNLKSCEMQLLAASRLLADVLEHLSPDALCSYPYQQDVIARFAADNAVAPESIMLSAGSSPAIDLIVETLAVPAGQLLLQEPVFEGWLRAAALRGVPVTRCAGIPDLPGTGGAEALDNAIRRSEPAVVALTNPGNPTGSAQPLSEIARLAGLAADHGHLLVVDECYGAFSGISHVPLLADHPNLLILRTLSKSWALAGGRLALTFGDPVKIDYLRRFGTDSAVSGPALAVARALCDRRSELEAIWREVVTIRDEFTRLVLTRYPGWRALPSRTNFVTFDTGRPGGGIRVEHHLAERRVRVRNVEDIPGLVGCVRFSLADGDTMRWLVDQLPAEPTAELD